MSKNQPLSVSIIVPVYNRPDEMEELLESLSKGTNTDFEMLFVEDGSTQRCDHLIEKYQDKLSISYYYKENTGPGQSRNYGCERAKGNYFIFLDSDCVIPPQYFEIVHRELTDNYVDCFGGPDAAHDDFSPLQKAINYAMTSFFTTGGIRGGGEKLNKFHPRSFNMGFSKEVFEKTGGFPPFQFAKVKAAGEDMDLSIQIIKLGFQTRLIKEAFVYHKRRTNIKQFLKQVFNFGYARITISQRHPESLKIVHFAPLVFTFGIVFLLFMGFWWSKVAFLPILIHLGVIFIDSAIKNKSLYIGFLSVITSYIQLIGYGLGFLDGVWEKMVLRK